MVAELDEGPEVVPDMHVGVQQQAVQEVAVGLLAEETKTRCRVVLEALAQFTAEAEICIRRVTERDVLGSIPEVGPLLWILQIAVALLVAQQLVGGRPAGGFRSRLCTNRH